MLVKEKVSRTRPNKLLMLLMRLSVIAVALTSWPQISQSQNNQFWQQQQRMQQQRMLDQQRRQQEINRQNRERARRQQETQRRQMLEQRRRQQAAMQQRQREMQIRQQKMQVERQKLAERRRVEQQRRLQERRHKEVQKKQVALKQVQRASQLARERTRQLERNRRLQQLSQRTRLQRQQVQNQQSVQKTSTAALLSRTTSRSSQFNTASFAKRRQESAKRFQALRKSKNVTGAVRDSGSKGTTENSINRRSRQLSNQQYKLLKIREFRNRQAVRGASETKQDVETGTTANQRASIARKLSAGGGKPLNARQASNDNHPYPRNYGFQGKSMPKTLKVGTVIDRYGENAKRILLGKYSSPAGTPFAQRSLSSTLKNAENRKFVVLKPLGVLAGKVEPWYDKKNGGGTQYMSTMSFKELIDKGYIKELDDD